MFHWRCGIRVYISVDKVLKKKLGVLEIAGIMIMRLPINFAESLFKIFLPPDVFFEVFMLKKIFILFDELLRSKPAILIEQIDFHDGSSISTELNYAYA